MLKNMAPSLATVAVVVSCNGRGYLETNLPSLLQQTVPFSKILIVDNGSSDGTKEWLNDKISAPEGLVEVIPLNRNLGFSVATNRGIEVALEQPLTQLIATINNDVRLAPTWLQEALTTFGQPNFCRSSSTHGASSRKVGSVATLVLQDADPERVDSAGISWAVPGRAQNRCHNQNHNTCEAPSETTGVWGASAAAALYSRDLLETIGLFDESFFAYQEDVDLALRSRLVGFQCRLALRARSWHLGHGTNRHFVLGGTRADYLNARNRWAVMTSAHLLGNPLMPMLRDVATDLVRSISQRRAPAVWLGTAHGFIRWPRSVVKRRALHRHLEELRLDD